MNEPTTAEDLLDQLINDWKREKPELDASAMHIVGRILQLGKRLEKRATQALQHQGIYYTDLDVLATLRRSGKPYALTPTELRKSVLITSGAMTALLDRLEKIGLLSRHADPNDGRIRTAMLTKKGKEVIDEAIKIRFAEAESAVAIFNETERKQLSKLLKKMLLSLESTQ